MALFDWFYGGATTKDILPEVPPPAWSGPIVNSGTNISLDKIRAYAESNGAIVIDIAGTVITIPPAARHLILERIKIAVQMADVADPDNDILNSAMRR